MIKKIFSQVYHKVKWATICFKNSKTPKIFCIGRNKTGTTSMASIFNLLDIHLGNQRAAELLTMDVSKGHYKDFIKYVKYDGVAFQDAPFSIGTTFKILDKEFPNSKFILTIRDSPEIWYNSLTKFHSKIFGNGKVPLKTDLMNAEYVYPGWAWEINRLNYDTPENDIYNKEILIQHYIDYNNSVINYFENQPQKLLVVNLKQQDASLKISNFLNSKKKLDKIPWENKT